LINKTENPVEWALLNYQLSDALEHLNELITTSMEAEDFNETDFRIELAHIYSHLNRAWNMRNLEGEMSSEKFKQFSSFPKDIVPL